MNKNNNFHYLPKFDFFLCQSQRLAKHKTTKAATTTETRSKRVDPSQVVDADKPFQCSFYVQTFCLCSSLLVIHFRSVQSYWRDIFQIFEIIS